MNHKMHLFAPATDQTLCGRTCGNSTTNPDVVTCKPCKRSYIQNIEWYENQTKDED